MEQIAYQFAHEYARSDPEEWRVERIVPGSQGSCLGLPRQYAPPSKQANENRFYAVGEKYDYLPHIHKVRDGQWEGRYTRQHKRYTTPVKDTPRLAALAYNQAVTESGLPEHYLIDLSGLNMGDDAEEQSA